MKRVTVLTTVVLIIGSIIMFGCGHKPASDEAIEKAIESQAKAQGQDVAVDLQDGAMSFKSKDADGNEVTVNQSGDGVEVTTKDGSYKTFGDQGGALPEGFPDDIPVFAGAKILTAMAEDQTFSIQATVPAPLDAVHTFYQTELKAKGWNEINVMSQAGADPMHMLNYKKDKRDVMVVISKNDDKNSHLTITTAKDE